MSKMTFALTLAALRRHPLSLAITSLLVVATASLLGISAPLALVDWLATGLVTFELWYACEPLILRSVGGYRVPTYAERERLEAAIGRYQLSLLVADTSDLAAARGLRTLVIGRDLIDLFEDRALTGFLVQVAEPVHGASLAGTVFVWLGNLPIVCAWCVARLLGQLGRLLALAVGASLVIPLILLREGFLCWCGRLFSAIIVGLLGALLVSNGFAAAGVGLLFAWIAVPAIEAIVAWESRRAGRSADCATLSQGFGPQLLEAVEFLALAEPRPAASGLLSLLCQPSASLVDRADQLRRRLGNVCEARYSRGKPL
jgi:hypothetical protein